MSPHDPDLDRLNRATPSRAADAIAAAFDPAYVLLATSGLVAARAASSWVAAIGWWALIAVTCVGLPLAALLRLVAVGRVRDRFVVVREQRLLPLMIALVWLGVGWGIAKVLGAPQPLLALVAALAVTVGSLTALSVVIKASFHTGGIAAAAGVLGHELGPLAAVLAAPAVVAVGWARWRAGRHGLGQILLGLGVGAVCGFVVYPAWA